MHRAADAHAQLLLQATKAGFKEPSFSDGLVEVVGFKDGASSGAVMAGVTAAVRLGQAAGVRIRIRADPQSGTADTVASTGAL